VMRNSKTFNDTLKVGFTIHDLMKLDDMKLLYERSNYQSRLVVTWYSVLSADLLTVLMDYQRYILGKTDELRDMHEHEIFGLLLAYIAPLSQDQYLSIMRKTLHEYTIDMQGEKVDILNFRNLYEKVIRGIESFERLWAWLRYDVSSFKLANDPQGLVYKPTYPFGAKPHDRRDKLMEPTLKKPVMLTLAGNGHREANSMLALLAIVITPNLMEMFMNLVNVKHSVESLNIETFLRELRLVLLEQYKQAQLTHNLCSGMRQFNQGPRGSRAIEIPEPAKKIHPFSQSTPQRTRHITVEHQFESDSDGDEVILGNGDYSEFADGHGEEASDAGELPLCESGLRPQSIMAVNNQSLTPEQISDLTRVCPYMLKGEPCKVYAGQSQCNWNHDQESFAKYFRYLQDFKPKNGTWAPVPGDRLASSTVYAGKRDSAARVSQGAPPRPPGRPAPTKPGVVPTGIVRNVQRVNMTDIMPEPSIDQQMDAQFFESSNGYCHAGVQSVQRS
jgi:hypothetical protein